MPTREKIVFGHRHIESDLGFVLSTEKPVDEVMNEHDRWFRDLGSTIDGDVVVMGLSCSDADMPYLRRIRRELPNSKWVFFYHEDGEDMQMVCRAKELGIGEGLYSLKRG